MITCTPVGGIGNQLFIIAACIGVADKLKTQFAIPEQWQFRSYFNIPNDNFINVDLPRYSEPEFHYTEINLDNINLWGYYQSKRYWAHCEEKVKRYLTPNLEIHGIKYKHNGDDSMCAVHIRGTDYKDLKDYHFNLPKEYYEAAMKKSGYKYFEIYTDDYNHAKAMFPDIKVTEGKRENDKQAVNDLALMSAHSGLIMANSSYSWWAAELGRKKKVFAPTQWFGVKKSNYILTDLYCDNWEIVKY